MCSSSKSNSAWLMSLAEFFIRRKKSRKRYVNNLQGMQSNQKIASIILCTFGPIFCKDILIRVDRGVLSSTETEFTQVLGFHKMQHDDLFVQCILTTAPWSSCLCWMLHFLPQFVIDVHFNNFSMQNTAATHEHSLWTMLLSWRKSCYFLSPSLCGY